MKIDYLLKKKAGYPMKIDQFLNFKKGLVAHENRP